jgi:hypothetical protein
MKFNIIHKYSDQKLFSSSVLCLCLKLFTSCSTTCSKGAISQAFTGGSHAPPGANEGVAIARAVMNELDSARFDPLSMLAVARSVGTALDGATMRVEGSVSFLAFEKVPQSLCIETRSLQIAQRLRFLGQLD